MVSDPGSKFDFGTFIAYLVPGYIVELLFFCIADIINIFVANKSIFANLNWGIAEIALVVTTSTVGAYLLGLLLDTVAHPLTLDNELQMKKIAYDTAVKQFEGLVKNQEVEKILSASKENTSDSGKRDLLIDSMFYRLASPEIWTRQNWHWAFYEFSRQIYLLSVPTIAVVTFYVTLQVVLSRLSPFDPNLAFLYSAGTTILVTFIGWIGPRKLLKRANDTDCRVYYRHRAWVLFAYLVDKDLLAENDDETESKKRKSTERKEKRD